MSCILRIAGRRLDPEKLLQGTRLRPSCIRHVGDLDLVRGKKTFRKTAYLAVDVSRRDFAEFGRQLGDAKRFLRTRSAELRQATADPAVETAVLDFGITARVDCRSVFAQFVRFPADVVALAASCGLALEVSLYPVDRPASSRHSRRAAGTRASR